MAVGIAPPASHPFLEQKTATLSVQTTYIYILPTTCLKDACLLRSCLAYCSPGNAGTSAAPEAATLPTAIVHAAFCILVTRNRLVASAGLGCIVQTHSPLTYYSVQQLRGLAGRGKKKREGGKRTAALVFATYVSLLTWYFYWRTHFQRPSQH